VCRVQLRAMARRVERLHPAASADHRIARRQWRGSPPGDGGADRLAERVDFLLHRYFFAGCGSPSDSCGSGEAAAGCSSPVSM
jgi:hypothetical protein